jgi:chromosome segregation ATPase
VAAFAECIASGALTSKFSTERRRLEGRIERLRTQHMEAVRDKSMVENRSRNLLEKLTAAEAENEDLSRRLVEIGYGVHLLMIVIVPARV